MKKILLLLTAVFAVFSASAIDYYRYRDQGSARRLEGRVMLIAVYAANNRNADFAPGEKHYIDSVLVVAEEWLVARAAEYGKTVTFSNFSLGHRNSLFNNAVVSNDWVGTEASPVNCYIIQDIFEALNYDEGNYYSQFMHEKFDPSSYDQCVVLVFSPEKGRSYAMRHGYGGMNLMLEGAMIYLYAPEGWGAYLLSSYTVAHEMLHLFGADDLYETYDRSAGSDAFAEKLYPTDIMLRGYHDVNSATLDRFTAWQVGLTDEFSEEFMPLSLKKSTLENVRQQLERLQYKQLDVLK